MTVPVLQAPPKPRMRGRLHQVAFFASIPAGIVLIALARSTAGRSAVIVYVASLMGLYGVSALYHRLRWSPRGRRWMKRLDHSMIYVLIAGTNTPVSLLVLEKPWSIVMLTVVWAGAALGVALKMLRIDGFQVLTGALYIVLGWAVIALAPQLIRGLGGASLVLMAVGGVLYTAGAVVLLRRKPDPVPSTFGYQEVWHAMVVAAGACHYVAVLLIARSVGG